MNLFDLFNAYISAQRPEDEVSARTRGQFVERSYEGVDIVN
jgi:hypothetical protein